MSLKNIPLIITQTFTQLTDAGETGPLVVERAKNHTFQYKVAAIGTNVIVKPQGSLDGSNWFDLASQATQTSNGTYSFTISNTPVKAVRFNWVSKTAGSPTIDVLYRGAS